MSAPSLPLIFAPEANDDLIEGSFTPQSQVPRNLASPNLYE